MNHHDVRMRMIQYLNSPEFTNREDAFSTNIPALIKINKSGMLTENSQEGIEKKDIRERAYLTGFLKNSKKFIEYINSHTDKVAFQVLISPIQIPGIVVTYSGTRPETRLFTTASKADMVAIRKACHLNKDDDAVFVAIFDPQYGRLATSKHGLYRDIMKSLNQNTSSL